MVGVQRRSAGGHAALGGGMWLWLLGRVRERGHDVAKPRAVHVDVGVLLLLLCA